MTVWLGDEGKALLDEAQRVVEARTGVRVSKAQIIVSALRAYIAQQGTEVKVVPTDHFADLKPPPDEPPKRDTASAAFPNGGSAPVEPEPLMHAGDTVVTREQYETVADLVYEPAEETPKPAPRVIPPAPRLPLAGAGGARPFRPAPKPTAKPIRAARAKGATSD